MSLRRVLRNSLTLARTIFNLVAIDNSIPAHEVHVGHWLAVPHQLRSLLPSVQQRLVSVIIIYNNKRYNCLTGQLVGSCANPASAHDT